METKNKINLEKETLYETLKMWVAFHPVYSNITLKEQEILSRFMYHHYLIKDEVSDDVYASMIIFSPEILDKIRRYFSMSRGYLSVVMTHFKNIGIIKAKSKHQSSTYRLAWELPVIENNILKLQVNIKCNNPLQDKKYEKTKY